MSNKLYLSKADIKKHDIPKYKLVFGRVNDSVY